MRVRVPSGLWSKPGFIQVLGQRQLSIFKILFRLSRTTQLLGQSSISTFGDEVSTFSRKLDCDGGNPDIESGLKSGVLYSMDRYFLEK